MSKTSACGSWTDPPRVLRGEKGRSSSRWNSELRLVVRLALGVSRVSDVRRHEYFRPILGLFVTHKGAKWAGTAASKANDSYRPDPSRGGSNGAVWGLTVALRRRLRTARSFEREQEHRPPGAYAREAMKRVLRGSGA